MAVLFAGAVDVRAIPAVAGVVAAAEHERTGGRADRDRALVNEYSLDDAAAVRATEMLGPGRQEQVEDLDQTTALDPVKQPQVELAARGSAANPRTLLSPDEHRSGVPPVIKQVTERHSERDGQRPQRLDRRVTAALLQVRQRRLGQVSASREGG